jgi:hypothetical protein
LLLLSFCSYFACFFHGCWWLQTTKEHTSLNYRHSHGHFFLVFLACDTNPSRYITEHIQRKKYRAAIRAPCPFTASLRVV